MHPCKIQAYTHNTNFFLGERKSEIPYSKRKRREKKKKYVNPRGEA